MQRKRQISVLFRCPLCNGLLVDATAIVPCLHTYCKSCIVRHSRISSACPQCGSYFKSDREYLRRDYILQRLIYRLFPGSLEEEKVRRRQFRSEQDCPERSTIALRIDISLKLPVSNENPKRSLTTADTESKFIYLQCPAEMKIGSLKRFLRERFQCGSEIKAELIRHCCRLDEDETVESMLVSFGEDFDVDETSLIFEIDLKEHAAAHKQNSNNNNSCDETSNKAYHRYPLRPRSFKGSKALKPRTDSTTTTTTVSFSKDSSLTWKTGVSSSSGSGGQPPANNGGANKETSASTETPTTESESNITVVGEGNKNTTVEGETKKSSVDKPSSCEPTDIVITRETKSSRQPTTLFRSDRHMAFPDLMRALGPSINSKKCKKPKLIRFESVAMSLSFPEAL